MFSITKSSSNGRIGNITYQGQSFSTPLLFPVVCLITGSTPRGGGLWKYILQADESNGLLRRNLPVMSQVLHFLDFLRHKHNGIINWRKQGIKQRYIQEIVPSVNYTAPMFLDSGGFQLLGKSTIDLSPYSLSLEDEQGVLSILRLQEDFQGDIIATLDYPLPPNLLTTEALERIDRTFRNATQTALILSQNSHWKPFLYVAAHGQNRQGIGNYVKRIFQEFQSPELKEIPFGFAIGSLVPLRGSKKNAIIIDLIRGLSENIPKEKNDKIPIHIFGITGSLMPFLAYLGIDSFDSSSYVQEARGMSYIDPHSRTSKPILELEELTCDCRVCKNANLEYIQEALISDIKGKPVHHGHFKSKYYADIALHNLEMDFRLLETTKLAIESDYLQEYLIEYVDKVPHLRLTLESIALEDDSLNRRLSRSVVSVDTEKIQTKEISSNLISLQHTPNDFDILKHNFQPSQNKKILLIIPCSNGKPYSLSRSHQFIKQRLEQVLGDKTDFIHKVTLSGLYGIVPDEYENHEAIMGYDFRLDSLNTSQISLLVNRSTEYLLCYNKCYQAFVSYSTSAAYRKVLKKVSVNFKDL
jgi:7-cyano-7-deazaguanine tRNA-ribosyltransferase